MGRPDLYTDEIRKICSVPDGRAAPEVCSLSKATRATVMTKLPRMVEAGQLHRAGTRKKYRFFAHQAHAEAWAEDQKRKAAMPPAPKPGRQHILHPKIKAFCGVPCGRSVHEIRKHTGATLGSLRNRLPRMVNDGHVYRAGKRRAYRYFTHEHHALAWDTKPDLAMLTALRKTEETADSLDDLTEEPTEAAKHVGLPRRGRGKEVYGLGKAPHQEKLPAGGTVTWPAHVRVTVAPVARDTRFTFDPPPGWKGELTKEWEQKRGHHG